MFDPKKQASAAVTIMHALQTRIEELWPSRYSLSTLQMSCVRCNQRRATNERMARLSTFAELLSELGLSELQTAIASGPEAPLTLRKAADWLTPGPPGWRAMGMLKRAGVGACTQRKMIVDALQRAQECGRLEPTSDKTALVATARAAAAGSSAASCGLPPQFEAEPATGFLVSVIIPSRRYDCLLDALHSVQTQSIGTARVETIVAHDASGDVRFESGALPGANVRLINLDERTGSRGVVGRGAAGMVRNIAMREARGHWLAFLDDDDAWLPTHLEAQLAAMREREVEMSCAEGMLGYGRYNPKRAYQLYNAEAEASALESKTGVHPSKFPRVLDLAFLTRHNVIITSSVVLSRRVARLTGEMTMLQRGEDGEYWLRALRHTQCAYLQEPLVHYDSTHGNFRRGDTCCM